MPLHTKALATGLTTPRVNRALELTSKDSAHKAIMSIEG